MAAHVINPDQLQMFMTPREMVGGAVTHANDIWGPRGPAPLNDEMITKHSRWKEKRDRNERHTGLAKSVAAEGVHEPLQIYHDTPAGNAARGFGRDEKRGMLRNGHHRFLAQYLSDPDRYMPVEHRAD